MKNLSRRQILRLALLTSTTAASLSSCTLLFPFTSPPPNRPPVKLTLYYGPFGDIAGESPPEERILIQASHDFTHAHPDIHITIRSVENLDKSSLIQLFNPLSSNHGDLFLSLATLPSMETPNVPISLTNVMTPVDSFLKRDKKATIKSFYPAAIERSTIQGKVIGLPRDIQPDLVIFYNEGHLNAIGIKPPIDSWTVDEFLNLTQEITKANLHKQPVTLRYGYADENPLTSLFDFIYVFGGRRVTTPPAPPRIILNSPAAIAGAQFYVDLTRKYHVAPTPAERLGLYENDPIIDFMLGRIPLLAAPATTISILHSMRRKLDWNIRMFPILPNVQRAWVGIGAAVYLARVSQHIDEAWEVAKDLCTGHGMKLRAQIGDVHPAAIDIAESSAYLNAGNPDGIHLFNSVGMAHMIPVDPSVSLDRLGLSGYISSGTKSPDYTATQHIIASQLDDLLNGKITPTQLLNEAARSGNKMLTSA